MTESVCSLPEALAQLEELAPGVPLLALGQTVFWDEPMKGGVALALRRLKYDRKLVAGVHDTDYFAKLPSGKTKKGAFKALPHNDTTTRGLWSAAGEFSRLFGSETVITRDALAASGLRIDLLKEARPTILDEATEAWGWKGIVSLDEHAPITAEVPLRQVFPELFSTFEWALKGSLEGLTGESLEMAERVADEFRTVICDENQPGLNLSDYYRALLPSFYRLCANADVPLEVSQTTELLNFNLKTCTFPRFEILGLFVSQSTREEARRAYDEAIRTGAGQYELNRFGTGAIPFDIFIPGIGRGTIRLGRRGAVFNTKEPQFLSFDEPLTGIEDFAKRIEAKFGTGCTIVGKAVSLIGMLAREFVFLFHEGASGYVNVSRKFHQHLAQRLNWTPTIHPILRVRYDAWSALNVTCSWICLPEPFERALGTEEICSPSFASRWQEVSEEQDILLKSLGVLRRPIDLIRFLDEKLGGSWARLAEEYKSLQKTLEELRCDLAAYKQERSALYDEVRSLIQKRLQAERAKGEHFRAKIFEKNPSELDLAERERLTHAVESIIHEMTQVQGRVHMLRRRQLERVGREDVRKAHERRRDIEIEAELKRLRIIRGAYTTAKGLPKATHRPSAWWYPLLSPDGLWFRETVDSALCYLEPLS